MLLGRAFADGALARQLAGTANGFRALALLLLRGLLEVTTQLHLAIDALALQLLLQRAQGLVDIVVAYGDLDYGTSPLVVPAPKAPGRVDSFPMGRG